MDKKLEFSLLFLSILIFTNHIRGFNLDLNQYTVFSGPEDSYFGFSVDFYQSSSKSVSVVVGAPRANTNQSGVSHGGSVFMCPWATRGQSCQTLNFDQKGDENITFGNMLLMAHKSNQWLGASVRTYNNYILACAPLFHWNVLVDQEEAMNTPVGNCQLLNMKTGELANYAPCREEYVYAIYTRGYPDRRYCEAGFTTDITKNGRVVLGAPGGYYFQGQIITASLVNIMSSGSSFTPKHSMNGETKTPQRRDYYDLYLGYSVAAGKFNNDNIPDYVVGVPNDLHTAGSVKIINGATVPLQIMKAISGTQIASYFGHSVAVTDINRDGWDDILIGAPLFMEQLSTQKFREVGQVYVYLQRNDFSFASRPNQILAGTYAYGRFGSAIAPLGDLDHDGFNDVAVGAPGSVDGGKVFIYLGKSGGLSTQYVQVIESPFRSLIDPPMFGFSIRGGTDIDDNGYPDLIIGAWGASKVVTYRAQAVVRTQARLSFFPDLLNPEDKFCQLQQSGTYITCFTIMACIRVSGHRIPQQIVFNTELQLDRMKQSMARRTLLLDSNQPYTNFQISVDRNSRDVCRNFTAYLLPEFKDKLSPIFISVNYSLADSQNAVLHGQSVAVGQTRIILNCGPDNVCIPDLQLKAVTSTEPILIGDENPALLIIEAENQGEGAYETELYISPPANTHYQGVLSNHEDFSALVCGQKKENGSVIVVCDLGNPLEAGQQLKAGLYFSMGDLEQVENHITFQMQIRSKNSQNSDSNLVQLQVNVTAVASLEMRGVSSPVDCVLPISKWESKDYPEDLDEVGPLIEHVYELRNRGPSPVNVKLTLEFPVSQNESYLLYVFANASEELISCQTDYANIDPRRLVKQESTNITVAEVHHFNKRDLSQKTENEQQWQHTVHVNCSSSEQCVVFDCVAAGLQRDERAIVRVMSRLWVQTFLKRPYVNYVLHSTAHYEVMNVPSKIQPDVLPTGKAETHTKIIWRSPDGQEEVPLWWIVVSIVAGLLLLAALSTIFWKMGFFKRNRPPSDNDDDDDDDVTQQLNGD
ncbi:integrin alpha-IIb precursor [Danio rerio]|uniref:Glycoprotein IIb n=1 Tax=Danio rerio TaxID=7955 RepID=Q6EIY7_DANRE|nr:integrin alpha-IIb [Danio rerio]AAQ82784.1 glycoprotein IIb [Danio rerio]|eukprot:NP_001003857.1 integrin alpha-IIb [Danio rerio]